VFCLSLEFFLLFRDLQRDRGRQRHTDTYTQYELISIRNAILALAVVLEVSNFFFGLARLWLQIAVLVASSLSFFFSLLHIERRRQTDRQTDREKHRERQPERERVRQRYTRTHTASEQLCVCVCGWRRRSEVSDFYIVCVGKETELEEGLPGSAIAS
jgi:hypothetical protein